MIMNEEQLKQEIINSHMQDIQETSFTKLPQIEEKKEQEEGNFEVLVIMKLQEIIDEIKMVKNDQRTLGHYFRGMNSRLDKIEEKINKEVNV